ncbi:hypothetical protein C8R44DRAFT_727363 [Mycena epipterygia]|nr:hypothetical protein C8R44DRAFT_727363 [Mycena epipterygia]
MDLRCEGNVLQFLLTPVYAEHELKWQKLYGPIYRLKGCFGDRLVVADPLALQYILNTPHFEHSPLVEYMIDLVYGMDSVVGLKGEAHRRVRAGVNLGFSASAVRGYQPVFEKVAQAITASLESSSETSIDICPLLGIATQRTTQSAAQILGDAIAARLPVWLLRMAIYLPTAVFLREAKSVAKRLGDQISEEVGDAGEEAGRGESGRGSRLKPKQWGGRVTGLIQQRDGALFRDFAGGFAGTEIWEIHKCKILVALNVKLTLSLPFNGCLIYPPERDGDIPFDCGVDPVVGALLRDLLFVGGRPTEWDIASNPWSNGPGTHPERDKAERRQPKQWRSTQVAPGIQAG